ncbi:MAG: hypothetical protein ACTHK3_03060 [Solirubrobacterales bacterium]
MREKLNENPLAQLAVLGVLLVVGAIFLLKGGGGEPAPEPEAESSTTVTSAPAITPAGETPVTGWAAPAPVPPPPSEVTAAFNAGETVVLLIVREGGIDDDMVREDTGALEGMSNVALFVVPAQKIARYAAITEGAGVNRVPALVVLRPKALSHGVPTASVNYGYQGAEDVVQAVVDARYKGRTLSYHP